MTTRPSAYIVFFVTTLLLLPWSASAQGTSNASAGNQAANVPAQAQRAQDAVEETVRRFAIGVDGGVGVDPELIMFGGHGTFRPIFIDSVSFRPGIEFGIGELTTLFGINLDVIYTFPGAVAQTRWVPYIGAGPNFTLSHQGFETTDTDKVTTTSSTGATTTVNDDETRNRFDFSDTDFSGGFNFIAGARNRSGLFVEMKATAYGVSNIRLLAGFNF